MEPITREEYYLAKIAGTYEGNTPEPVTIEEYYLATMAGDYSGNTPQPVTRLQYYMAKVAGVWGGSIPAPVTRLEYYWAAIASGEGKVFPPVTREEHFLVLVADAYSVVLTVVTGNPALLENSKGNRGLESLTLYGKSTQVSTTGAQLISLNDSYGVTTVNGVTKTPIGISAWKLEGISKENALFYPYSSQTFLSLSKGDYVFSVFGTSKAKARYTIVGGGSSGYIQTGQSQKISIQEDAKLTFNFLVENGVKSNGILMIMLNSGSTSLPWEPYTGGAPSPSPSYPQEIESAGQDGEIGIEVGNNGYIQKGTYFLDVRQFPLKKGYTYYIKGEKIIGNDINCFVLNEYNKNFKNSAELFNYGYTTKKLTIPNSTGIVDEECRMPMRYDKDGYTFTVKAEGLYLYQAVNEPAKNTDEFYVGYTPNIVNEEYKKQTLIVPTPNGLPGIPVSSGGNYTDEKGQQWVCDEVDFKKGVYVQRIGKRTITSKDVFHKSGMSTDDVNYFSLGNFSLHIGTIGEKDVLMSNCFVAGINHGFSAWGKIFLSSAFDGKVYFSVEAQKYPDEETFKQWAVENGLMFLYQLADIVETHLTAEELSAYKTLRTYSPTTTVINDAGAGMSVGYAKMK